MKYIFMIAIIILLYDIVGGIAIIPNHIHEPISLCILGECFCIWIYVLVDVIYKLEDKIIKEIERRK